MSSSLLQALNKLMAEERSEVEKRGVRIGGYAGGSREGPVWHYDFSVIWPAGPDEASVRVLLWWGPFYDGVERDEIRSTCLAEIYREGQPSRIKERSETTLSATELSSTGLLVFVERQLSEGRVVLTVASSRRADARGLS